MDATKKAKDLVVDYFNARVDRPQDFLITEEQVFIIQFSKDLQNWKAIITTVLNDGIIYEVTYNGNRHEAYVCAYKKCGYRCVHDEK
jgi:hypothetical protein